MYSQKYELLKGGVLQLHRFIQIDIYECAHTCKGYILLQLQSMNSKLSPTIVFLAAGHPHFVHSTFSLTLKRRNVFRPLLSLPSLRCDMQYRGGGFHLSGSRQLLLQFRCAEIVGIENNWVGHFLIKLNQGVPPPHNWVST